ncbi:MAG: serine hydrolase [Candidatus Hydrogenedentes bacterium]|nr:serine hydrolase [Candidatus Hydrogenedentota bacterium]
MIAMRFLHAVLAFMLACALNAGAASIPEAVKAAVRERVDAGQAASMAVGLVDAADADYFFYGHTVLPDGPAPNEDTVYEIGSITKVFTGILLGDMIVRGEVALDDAVAGYLPPGVKMPRDPAMPVTLRHLTTHTSGLARMPSNFASADPANPYADYTVARLHAYLNDAQLSYTTGSRYLYSNTGAALLGYVLERAAGKPYAELLRERVLEAMGLTDTAITLTDGMRARLAHGHAGKEPAPNWDMAVFAGAGSLRSTAADMVKFLRLNLGMADTPLKEALALSHQAHTPAGVTEARVGLGWHLRAREGGGEIVWHNGGTGGYRTFAGFDAARGCGAVVLANSNDLSNDDLGFHLLDEIALIKQSVPRTKVALTEAQLKRYAGNYRAEDGTVFDVRYHKERLEVKYMEQPRLPVVAASETKFFYEALDAEIEFQLDASGAVTGLELHQAGMRVPARKVE